jgi:purine-cytosine permease-like protein
VRGGCSSLGVHSGSKPRLAWFRDCNDYEGMVVALLLVAAIAAIWWLVGHKGWGAVQKLVFWVVLLVVLWVLVAVYGVPHPSG